MSCQETLWKNYAGVTKIRLDKCDTDLYREVVQESLEAKILHPPSTALDADMYVKTLTTVLHVEAEVASPIRPQRKSKKGFPIWIDKVATAFKKVRRCILIGNVLVGLKELMTY